MWLLISGIVILIIIIIIWYWWKDEKNGYWSGTEAFNTGLGVKYSIVYISSDIFIWVLENSEGQVVAQSYSIKSGKDGTYDLQKISGDGDSVFNGPITFTVVGEGLEIKGDVAGTNQTLFEGLRKNL